MYSMSNNNFNSIQPAKKNSKLRRSLDKFKKNFSSPRRINTRINKKPKHKLKSNQVKYAMNGNYGSLNRNIDLKNNNIIEYINLLHPTNNKNVPIIPKKIREKIGVSEYKSKAQQILNQNLKKKKKRSRLNRFKNFVKQLSPRKFVNRIKRSSKRKKKHNRQSSNNVYYTTRESKNIYK